MDDIDKVRDDLQSTKQMLALEMRNKEAQERENKRLLARLQNLEAELEKERSNRSSNGETNGVGSEVDEKVNANSITHFYFSTPSIFLLYSTVSKILKIDKDKTSNE